jgi:hypothetical protein
MEEWKNGRLEGGNVGTFARGKIGRMEGWKNGRREWKMGFISTL